MHMQGIWGGMIGGLVVQTLVLIWVTFRTDWNKEVYFQNLKEHILFTYMYFHLRVNEYIISNCEYV
jgi:hypothetical protein